MWLKLDRGMRVILLLLRVLKEKEYKREREREREKETKNTINTEHTMSAHNT